MSFTMEGCARHRQLKPFGLVDGWCLCARGTVRFVEVRPAGSAGVGGSELKNTLPFDAVVESAVGCAEMDLCSQGQLSFTPLWSPLAPRFAKKPIPGLRMLTHVSYLVR